MTSSRALWAGILAVASISAGRTDVFPPSPVNSDLKLGSYYFPGHFNAARWSPMKAYGKPVPLLGYYRDGAPDVSDWHLKWAVENGLSFFLFDWYYDHRVGRVSAHNTALEEGFLKAKHRQLMEFALMWCNEESPDDPPYTPEQMTVLGENLGRYFREPNYLRIDGRPMVVVSRPARLAKSFGADPGMEEGTGWVTYGGGLSRFVKRAAHTGVQCAEIGPGEGCKAVTPTLAVVGRTYRVAAWVKCSPGARASVRSAVFGADGKWRGRYEAIGDSLAAEWTEVSKELLVSDTEVGRLNLEVVAEEGTVWIDDASITVSKEGPPPEVVFVADCRTGEVRVPADSQARSVNVECVAEGGAVRLAGARLERLSRRQ